MIKAKDVEDVLTYHPETGDFIWKERSASDMPDVRLRNAWNKKFAGKVAGRSSGAGYIQLSIKGNFYYAHRVAWLINYNEFPESQIDHIDGNKENNAISNLRTCSHNENQHNQTKRKNNKSGYKGVSWMKSCSRWQAQICLNKKVRHLGVFKSAEDAARAYDAAAREIHGEFAKTNF